MKFTLSLLFVFCSLSLIAQRAGKRKVDEDQAYHALRVKMTVPPYGLTKIQALIKNITTRDDNKALSQKDYSALSLREKFTYNMIHAESYSQNCDAEPPESDENKKIYAYLPDAFGEYAWSERQTKFLSGNRDSVIAFMRESMKRTKRAGINFKQAMLEINAREMIPDIITTYRAGKTKDLDLLTVLMHLMKDNEYEPFLLSGSYKKLYAEETSYKNYLNYSKGNEDLIIKRVTDFYNADKK
ncbi:MAG TPA: hypothetical protein VFI06_08420 [Chitinophagaceae bacterium]|nr:hypothetical protein [Chitinophagaceae bacterium]